MAHINLLPWREELRKQRQKEFVFQTGGAVAIAALLLFFVHMRMSSMIEAQQGRNAFLSAQISQLDKKIRSIKTLEETKKKLLARMHIIQRLQRSRPQSVHLMDQLVRTLPDGVYLTSIKQKGDGLTLSGMAQSNARVSAYMRNIAASKWLTDPRLDFIETQDAERRHLAKFTLQAKQQAPKEKGDKTAVVAGAR
ncbi:MAG: PilN domain-containing protein [Gammaproteobacteria bacterium]